MIVKNMAEQKDGTEAVQTPALDCDDIRDQYLRTRAIQDISHERCYTDIPFLCGSDVPEIRSFCGDRVRRCMNMAEDFPLDRMRFALSGCPMDVDDAEVERYKNLHLDHLAVAD
ncbi:MAG: hypothetical protein ACD_65C00320G0001 [uncultured bacterium]|nr:MAG: hypothetical protein ACD_65C00320G0001 [uncultured bacterium]